MEMIRKRNIPLNNQRSLRFSPTAWAKLLYVRDHGDTEVGGFGIAPGNDLLTISDVQLVKQDCTPASVAFDDEAVADFFDSQVDQELRPEQFARIWVHTHPGNCASPSLTDEETFARVFGRADWAVMFILAQGGQTYARLRFNVGPGGEVELPVELDFSLPFPGSEQAAWKSEYMVNVTCQSYQVRSRPTSRNLLDPDGLFEEWDDHCDMAIPLVAERQEIESYDNPLGETPDDDQDG